MLNNFFADLADKKGKIAGAVIFPLAGQPMFLGSPKGAMALFMVHLLYTGLITLIIGKPSSR